MKIKLCFSGWLNDFELSNVYEPSTGDTIWLGESSKETILKNLQSGFWTISLVEALSTTNEPNIEIFDIEEST